ncbi:hypothetical protein [Saccharolobus islandicus]|uniref:Conserved conjugative plasmid membrane protein n=1 Tax=Saccharolobus islandicus (strain L.D.8.5 / Lassen \|nr:hypothetical protein [Sulfolobus islandicus]ADB87227.1 conserved conjugative plasmid membrane protein [Sulfolobus islandicus L.D.8.5]
MKARRLEFGYLKTISSADEKSFPMLIRTVSMKELLVIFPSIIIGLVLFLKHEIVYAAIPFMLAVYVLLYNEKSVPFYYQFLAFIEDLLTPQQKPNRKNRSDFKKYEKELKQLIPATLTLSVILYTIQLELYTEKINFAILVGLSIIAGLLTAFVVVKLSDLASKQ